MSLSDVIMTIKTALSNLTNDLKHAGVDEGELKAAWIIAHVLGADSHLHIMARPDDTLTDDQWHTAQRLSQRCCHHEPLQYLFENAAFRDCELHVSPAVLIPRPETEQLVQLVLDTTGVWEHPVKHIIDIGTGSGCIAITLALEHPDFTFTGIDLSEAALDVASRNQRHCQTPGIRWLRNDLLTNMPEASCCAVVANLPYVGEREWDALEPQVRLFEPRTALCSGPDGLDCLTRAIGQSKKVLTVPGWIFLEIGDTQRGSVEQLMDRAGFRNIRVHCDWAGKERFISGKNQ